MVPGYKVCEHVAVRAVMSADTCYRRSLATWRWCNFRAVAVTTKTVPFVYSSIVDTINARKQSFALLIRLFGRFL